jgi:2-phosphosulfolactate phosphatase
MLTIDLDFVPTPRPADVAIVVDVLRMTTTAATMLAHDRRELVVVAEVEEATILAREQGALLYGERGGVALPGFDGGNSPFEHVGDGALPGERVVLCTSNGSKAVEAVAEARHVLLGAIVNAGAVAWRAVTLAERDVRVVCAGTAGVPSLDDVLAAGCIVRALVASAGEAGLSDAARIALELANGEPDLAQGLRRSRHGRILLDLGFAADIDYAAELDRLDVVPERVERAPALFSRPRTRERRPVRSRR